MKIDANRALAEASARHGIRLSSDDPALAVATLAALLLESTLEQGVASIEAVPLQCAKAIEVAEAGVATRASTAVVADLKRLISVAERHVNTLGVAQQRQVSWMWIAVGAAAGAMLFASGFMCAQLVG